MASSKSIVNGTIANSTIVFENPLPVKFILEFMAVKGREPASFTDFTLAVMNAEQKPEIHSPVVFLRYVWRMNVDEYACLYLNDNGVPHIVPMSSKSVFNSGLAFAIRNLDGHILAP